jgi:AAA15 family ATPase/GTPase
MILEYGAKNFFCFKEWISVSFKLSANCPEYVSKGKSVSKILCVKGANAAGKTNALKVLAFLREFVVNSFNYKPDEEIKIESFFNNDDPIEFYVEFFQDDKVFRYELVLNKAGVISEVVYKKQKRSIKSIERKNDKITARTSEYKELDVIKLRRNASLISTANQYEIGKIGPIYNFFKSIIPNVTYGGLSEKMIDVGQASRLYHQFPDHFLFAKDIIKKCDLGIKDIVIHSKKEEDGTEIFFPIFYYGVDGSEKLLTFYSQSSGTKSLYLQLGFYKAVLDVGGLLVFDEFDIDLHPHILPVLLDTFTDDHINVNDAQIIFTTHNSEILDFLGKYRTILVNKDENQCYGYRLDEIPGDIIRNDRPLSPLYNAGKIGGVPKI